MQLKFDNNKITGIYANNIDDLNYIFENLKDKNIYKINLNEKNYNMMVKDYLLNCDEINEIFNILNLNIKIINTNISTLSFSEKIRIDIACALIKKSKCIYINCVLPFFDHKSKYNFLKLIIKLKKLYKITIIISDIEINNIFEVIDKLIIVKNKDIIYNGEKYEFYISNHDDFVEKPLCIILKEKILKKIGIDIGNTDNVNELIKAIYRELR